MIFDTHIHLNDEQLLNNLDVLLENAYKKGVKRFLCVGWDVESSKIAVQLANKYKEVYAAIGVIPTSYKTWNEKSINDLKEIFKTSNKIVAIGEIGLDYYWENSDEVKKIQKEMFIKQINLANELNLPISIHARDSLSDVLAILKEHRVINAGVMHCYSGSLELAKEFIKLGFKIAFGGVLTFKNSRVTKEVISGIELKDIVFETDAPYLSPVPFRGKTNLPEYIYETVLYASQYLNISMEDMEEISTNNANLIFHVKSYEE